MSVAADNLASEPRRRERDKWVSLFAGRETRVGRAVRQELRKRTFTDSMCCSRSAKEVIMTCRGGLRIEIIHVQ